MALSFPPLGSRVDHLACQAGVGVFDTLNSRREQDDVSNGSRKIKEAICCACPLKAGRTAAGGYIAGLSISKPSLVVVYILPPNRPMASRDLQSTSPFLTMSG
jgi:hypothetical protein